MAASGTLRKTKALCSDAPTSGSGQAGGRIWTKRTAVSSIQRLLDKTEGAVEGHTVSLRDVLEHLGSTSSAGLMVLLALIIITPASGIPLVSSICGLSIALIAGQMIIGRTPIWLPDWLLRRQINSRTLERAIGWLRRPAAWLDGLTARRLAFLVSPPLAVIPLSICILCGMAMPFLEFVPFTSSVLALVVAILGIAIIACDGLLALVGTGMVSGIGAGLVLLVT